jgi:hypothetical protein
MKSIAEDVVGGFTEFLRQQRETEGEARLTLVQFDSEDPFEILIDGIPLREVTDLDRHAYQPRSLTPLYDALGRMMVRVDGEVTARAEAGLDAEDQVVLIITDGLENASSEFNRSRVFDMVSERREQGWVFVFLGADQDAYAEGEKVGVSAANRIAWDSSKAGAKKMWKDVSYSTSSYRTKEQLVRQMDKDRFYEEDPEGGPRVG